MNDGGKIILALVLGLVCVVVVVSQLLAIGRENTLQEQERTAQIQAAERERTERERLTNATQQQAAGLRAEQDARTTNGLLLILAVGAMAVVGLLVGGGVLFGVSWFEGKQTQRALLLIEAQRAAYLPQQLAARYEEPPMLLLPVERPEAARGRR